jgi:AcrR family transcriptional regulator
MLQMNLSKGSTQLPDKALVLGLRERKKAKTRAAIQEHALRLFLEQGYEQKTVDQIAEAAEVAPRTFFRYFPTKEDVVLFDLIDPLLVASFERQPPEVSAAGALRRAMKEILAELTPTEREHEERRQRLMRQVPELRARMVDSLARQIDLIAELVARRVRRAPSDIAVRAFSGATVGLLIEVLLIEGEMEMGDYVQMVDAALAQLEAGLPL